MRRRPSSSAPSAPRAESFVLDGPTVERALTVMNERDQALRNRFKMIAAK